MSKWKAQEEEPTHKYGEKYKIFFKIVFRDIFLYIIKTFLQVETTLEKD